MRIGFTGTRRGMTDQQKTSMDELLFRFFGMATELHHGDCIGADANAHGIARGKNYRVVVHPPVDETHRAGCVGYDEFREPKTHFARNRDIVNETDVLIATPWQTERPAPKTGGGTWYTIEYAEKLGKQVTIIWPNGALEILLSQELP